VKSEPNSERLSTEGLAEAQTRPQRDVEADAQQREVARRQDVRYIYFCF
jgi:hypothetical protein